jgi:hypothetical protein
MNAHAFRSDDLATACRTTVEQEEERRRRATARDERRKRWANRERRFTNWWQDAYGVSAIIKIVGAVALFLYVAVLTGVCLDRIDDASQMADKLACLRACVVHKPIVSAGLVSRNTIPHVCLCYRKDGTPAVLVPESRFEELKKP